MKINIFFSLLFVINLASCNYDNGNELKNQFTTWEDPCFDRCASIWLIKHFVDSTATFDFIEFGEKITEGIPFDVPGAELGRQKNICCFESVIQKYQLDDPAFKQMSKIIHDIDVNKWGVKVTQDADSLEAVFNTIREQTITDQELLNKTAEIFVNMYKNYR